MHAGALAGTSVLMVGGGPALRDAVAGLFAGAGAEVRLARGTDGEPAALLRDLGSTGSRRVLIAAGFESEEPGSAALEAFALVDFLKASPGVLGGYPRQVIALAATPRSAGQAAAEGSLKALVVYATAHLGPDEVSINLVRHADSAQGCRQAADTALALASGLLDDVRGQILTLRDA
jgi:hypothetical protein